MSKIISGFNYANRVLALQVANLEETIKALIPHFVYCGKPIEGKNVQHKLEVALGYETKTQKLPEVRRMKIVLEQLAEGAEPANKVKTTKETFASTESTLTFLAELVTGALKAEADAKEAAKPVKAEKPAKAPKTEAKATETKASAPAKDEAKAAATAAPTVMGVGPQRDPKTGRFLPRA